MPTAEQEHQEILREVMTDKKPLPPPKQFIWMNLGLVIIILTLLAWYVPSYAFPPQAKSGNVPTLAEVLPGTISIPERPSTMNIQEYVFAEAEIKLIASRVVTATCSEPDSTCYAHALFYFVRDTIKYVNDPVDEYYETPQETLLAASADCDGQAILLASLLQAVGIETRFHYQPQHVVVDAYLPKRSIFSSQYTREWLLLDPTCKTCRPGYQ